MENSKPFLRLQNLLTQGNLWLYILSIIRRGKKAYAYGLPERMEREYGFRPNQVMIYVVLYKLEGEGLINSSMEERRKYYRLTDKGRGALQSGKKYLASLGKRL